MYKRLLVPVDGSQTSTRALHHAAALARPLAARMRLIHVIDELGPLPPSDPSAMIAYPQLIASLKAGGQQILDEAAEYAVKHGVDCEEALIESHGASVSQAILEEARKWQADVICMGTHGKRGLFRLMVGSDAERVLRETPVPVLLVRGEETS